jgi:hypothetical protein
MDDTENLFAMAFEELSEGVSASSLGGRNQLLLAPRSKAANL